MVAFYVITFFWAIFNLFWIARSGRFQMIYLLLLGLTIVVANLGYLSLALSQNVETAILANKVTYMGGCYIPLFMCLTVTELCNIRISNLMKYILTTVSVVIMVLCFSVGYSDIYYQDVQLHMENGVSYITKTYGPTHVLFPIMLYSYIVAAFIVLIYSFFRRNKVSYKTTLLLFIVMLAVSSAYIFERKLGLYVELLPLAYDFMMVIMIMILGKMKLYDMTTNVLNVWNKMEEYGYIVFDQNKRYMSCNRLALKYFPELEKQYIDDSLHYSANDDLAIVGGMIEAAEDSSEGTGVIHDLGNKSFRFNLSKLESGKKINGYVVEFFDVTKEQRYQKMLEGYNDKLSHEVAEKTKDILHLKDQLILGMASMVESRDNSTGGHIKRTSMVVSIFAEKLLENRESLHVSKAFLDKVAKAAPMHDLGKIAVDDVILRKNGKFTDEEYEKMKCHAAEGGRIVDTILDGAEEQEFVDIARNVACYHHEKWNGKGYPYGLSGEEIPLEARIMALADVFDALVSKRCYKDSYSYDRAFSIIEESLGEHFDPVLGRLFMECRPSLERLYDDEINK
ncbi:MAG: HD domain-containing protein [Pseudobutyrivibrio sp.]|nr:HD domain-containing protein [Pseudobutyrivibrio sp.]